MIYRDIFFNVICSLMCPHGKGTIITSRPLISILQHSLCSQPFSSSERKQRLEGHHCKKIWARYLCLITTQNLSASSYSRVTKARYEPYSTMWLSTQWMLRTQASCWTLDPGNSPHTLWKLSSKCKWTSQAFRKGSEAHGDHTAELRCTPKYFIPHLKH